MHEQKEFKQYFIIPATPQEVYAALTQEITLQLWTGASAQMQSEPETIFSWWDGNISGMNKRFVTDTLIEQEWFFGDENPNSLVTIKLHPHKKGTSLEVIQKNIPAEAYENIVEGWQKIVIPSLVEFYE